MSRPNFIKIPADVKYPSLSYILIKFFKPYIWQLIFNYLEMAEKKLFHKSKGFYIFLFLAFAVYSSAGLVLWRNYKYNLVNKKLDNLVTGKSKGLYQLNYKNLIIDEVLGNISAENVEMIPDSTVYLKLDRIKYRTLKSLLYTNSKTYNFRRHYSEGLLNKEISAHIIKLKMQKLKFY